MLDTLYFLVMLAGIAWLAWWATAGASASWWSPFDMREPPPTANPWRPDLAEGKPPQPPPPGALRWRERRGAPPQSGWQRRR